MKVGLPAGGEEGFCTVRQRCLQPPFAPPRRSPSHPPRLPTRPPAARPRVAAARAAPDAGGPADGAAREVAVLVSGRLGVGGRGRVAGLMRPLGDGLPQVRRALLPAGAHAPAPLAHPHPPLHRPAHRRGGAGQFVDRLAADVARLGGRILTDAPVTDLIQSEQEGVTAVTHNPRGADRRRAVLALPGRSAVLRGGGMQTAGQPARQPPATSSHRHF